MKKILLLIDPNQTSRSNLATFLTTLNFKVVQVDSLRAGLDHLTATYINLVVVNDILPEVEEAAKKIQRDFGIRAMAVLSSGKFTKAQVTQNMGYIGSFAIPYSGEEIKNQLETQFKLFQGGAEAAEIKEGTTVDASEGEFCAAFIDDFMKNPVSRFDLYFKVNESKFIKVTRGGTEVNMDLFYRLKANNIDKIFLKKEDYKKYISLNIEKLSFEKEVSKEKREEQMGFLVSTSNLIMNNVYIDGIDKDLFMMG
jgi:hypothetical protein